MTQQDLLTIQVHDVIPNFASAHFVIPVINDVLITTASLPNATQFIFYSTPITMTGSAGGFNGLTVIGNSGTNTWSFSGLNLVGTPSAAETANLTILGFDVNGVPAATRLSLTVVAGAGGTLTLQQDGFPQPPPQAAVGIPYELGISVTNTGNLVSWTVLSPSISASFITLTNTRAIFSWLNPTPLGAISIVIQATDTVTLNTGTITLNI